MCSSQCSVTCTADGRKYDSLAGVGGPRATCVSNNFMCQTGDPYFGQYNVLVHEFGHTVHLIGLSDADGYKYKASKKPTPFGTVGDGVSGYPRHALNSGRATRGKFVLREMLNRGCVHLGAVH